MNYSDTSSEEIECFLDPDNEIFFGPISEREREIRKPLPRRTIHPSEMAELREKGMTFLEWEAHKNQLEKKETTFSTENSFSSCNSEGESVKNVSGENISGVESMGDSWDRSTNNNEDASLNDTWEIQEKMLALAEKLERGEDIPEFGICHNSSEKVEKDQFSGEQVQDKNNLFEDSFDDVQEEVLTDKLTVLKLNTTIETEDPSEDELSNSLTKREDSIEYLVKQLESPSRTQLKTPPKTFFNSPRAPLKTSSCQKNKTQTMHNFSHFKSKSVATPSPVGMYIRSLPEPMLIENIRSSNKKHIDTNAMSYRKEAIRNSDGRWSITEKKNVEPQTENKENKDHLVDFIPVLPTVLHMAAASMVNDVVPEVLPSTPWSKGKIGKLLERNIAPTVLKHQGRIQMSKARAQTSNIVRSPFKSEERSKGRRSMMDVSVLEHVSGSLLEPNSPVRKIFTPKK